jgi:OmpA-OmpF porin, OOP family
MTIRPGLLRSSRSFLSTLGKAALTAGAAFLGLGGVPKEAAAQQRGYTADRLILAPNPDDGIATMRPTMHERTRFFGSLTLDYIRRPLHITSITSKSNVQRDYSGGVISNQANAYAVAGAEVLERFSLSVMLPITFVNTSNDPSPRGVTSGTDVKAGAIGDLRFDARVRVYSSEGKKFNLGLAGAVFLGTGNEFSFAGDGGAHELVQILLEERPGPFILTQNLGLHLRDKHKIAELEFSNETVFSAGVFIPLRNGKVRVGGEIYGSTGIASGSDGKSQFFKGKNTPLEWLGEVRVALSEDQHLWFNGGAGTLILPGYSAPDFRVVAQLGYWFDIKDTAPPSPPRRFVKVEERVEEHSIDTDGDGLPDSIDACPTVPEDHRPPDPNDGCPAPSDRDKDGIPDDKDKCPDQPEDKDGIDDTDGCPEDDVDGDGVPDVKDACPREPGQPSPDPKQNGCPQFIRRIEGSNEIQILKKIEFDTGKATIKPVSFPILDEVYRLLKASPQIKKVSIEGHTDSRGARDMNMKLSDDRAHSVMNYLVEKGIDKSRLSAQGFGPEKPLESNDTDAGRQKNRRVEFHIQESD